MRKRLSYRGSKEGWLLMLLFFYVYSVQFSFFPLHSSRLIEAVALVYIILFAFAQKRVNINREGLSGFLLFLLFFAWVLVGGALNGYSDGIFMTGVFLLLLHAFAGALFFALLFNRLKFDFAKVVLFLQVAIVIQAFFIVMYFVSWDFRSFSLEYIPASGNIDFEKNLFRSKGLMNSSGASLSLVQAFGVLFTSYLLAITPYKSKKFIYLIASFALLFLSIFLTGRTGLLMFPVALLFLSVFLMGRERVPKNIFYFVFIFPVTLIAAFFVLKFGYQYFLGGFTTAWGEDGFDRLVRWVSGEFFGSDGVRSKTMMLLRDHWFAPEDMRTFFVGDQSTWSENRIRSDIGFVRLWYAVGLFGALLLYISYFYVFLTMVLRAPDQKAKIMFALLGMFMFVLEMKEPFLMNASVVSVIFVLWIFLLSQNGGHRRIEAAREGFSGGK